MQYESDEEKSKQVAELAIEVDASLSKNLRLWLIPFCLACAIGLCGLLIRQGQTEFLGLQLIALNRDLLLAGALSFFLLGAHYDYRINGLGKRLFRQKKEKSAPPLTLPQVDEVHSASLSKWTGFDEGWLHEGEGGNVPSWLGMFIVGTFTNGFFLFAFLMFLGKPLNNPMAIFWKDFLKALILIGASYLKVSAQNRTARDLKETFKFVAQNPSLHYLLKTDASGLLGKLRAK